MPNRKRDVFVKIVNGEPHIDEIELLLKEYLSALGRDLSFQNVAMEFYDLKSKYVPPNGRLICAQTDDGDVIGCVAYHKHNDVRCEVKRLYVKPEYRKNKTGAKLVEEIIRLAANDGYKEMVLDTIKPLESAIYLYKKFGFTETEAYYNNPMPDVVYMKKEL